jgi:hypothetical protein
MTVIELIEKLQFCDPYLEVEFLDVSERNNYYSIESVSEEENKVVLRDF